MLVPASPEAGHSWGTAGDKPEESSEAVSPELMFRKNGKFKKLLIIHEIY